MESNRKRRGFMKGKLMPFYRASKPSNGGHNNSMQYMTVTSGGATKVMTNKPNQSVHPSAAASVGFLVHQDYLIAQPKPNKVSFVLPTHHDSTAVQRETTLYGGVTVDEGVDSKAANYISMVQERFKLERVNSERIKCQDKS